MKYRPYGLWVLLLGLILAAAGCGVDTSVSSGQGLDEVIATEEVRGVEGGTSESFGEVENPDSSANPGGNPILYVSHVGSQFSENYSNVREMDVDECQAIDDMSEFLGLPREHTHNDVTGEFSLNCQTKELGYFHVRPGDAYEYSRQVRQFELRGNESVAFSLDEFGDFDAVHPEFGGASLSEFEEGDPICFITMEGEKGYIYSEAEMLAIDMVSAWGFVFHVTSIAVMDEEGTEHFFVAQNAGAIPSPDGKWRAWSHVDKRNC